MEYDAFDTANVQHLSDCSLGKLLLVRYRGVPCEDGMF